MAWPWRRRSGTFTVEQLVEIAEYFADQEDWDRALHFVQAALERAPTSARLRMDEAFFLQELGRTRAATRAYAAAAKLCADGEPLFHLGLLLLREGRLEEASRALADAIDRSPELVLDAEEEPDLAQIASDPAFRAARRRALARL